MRKIEDGRYYNAGENFIHRYGKKAQQKVMACMTPNEQGFYSIFADGGKYWTIGTSEGKFGEFAKFGDNFLSVNKAGYVWAKVGTPKAEIFLAMVNHLLEDMKETNAERVRYLNAINGIEDDE